MSRKITATDVLFILLVLLLVAAIVPRVILYQREESRANTCENNLRQFGIGMEVFSGIGSRRRYCTGAFDWKRDGCPDKNSWIGNLIELEHAIPGKMLCPANPVRGLNTLNDLIGSDPGTAAGSDSNSLPPIFTHTPGIDQKRVTGTFCENFVTTFTDGSKNPLGTLEPGSSSRLTAVQLALLDGFNSNYATSWFLTRYAHKSAICIDKINNPFGGVKCLTGDQSDLSGASGVLEQSIRTYGEVSYNAIPILADSAEDISPSSILAQDLAQGLKTGSRLGQSNSGGSAFWARGANPPRIASLSSLCSVTHYEKQVGGIVGIDTAVGGDTFPLPDAEGYGGVDLSNPSDGRNERLDAPKAYGGKDDNLLLQDTRSFGSVHVIGKKRYVIMLFVDFAVKRLEDLNNDGYLNPGFPIDTTIAENTLKTSVGYTNARAEVGPAELYPGVTLNTFRTFGIKGENSYEH
jgi:hypothetical protein